MLGDDAAETRLTTNIRHSESQGTIDAICFPNRPPGDPCVPMIMFSDGVELLTGEYELLVYTARKALGST